jgi:hypothetical protein
MPCSFDRWFVNHPMVSRLGLGYISNHDDIALHMVLECSPLLGFTAFQNADSKSSDGRTYRHQAAHKDATQTVATPVALNVTIASLSLTS